MAGTTGRPELTDRIGRLDHRRRMAQLRAPIWFGLSMLVIAVMWAAAVVVGLAMLARGWSWLTGAGFADVPLWGWAPEVVATATVLLVLAVFLVFFQAGARGVGPATLEALGDLDEPAIGSRIANVATELAIGLGAEPPVVRILDDPAPNALSIPHRRWGPTLVVTTGANGLARDELEAILAHELVHRHAPDARWAAAAQWGLARVRSAGFALLGLGSFLAVGAFYALTEAEVFLPTPFLGGVALAGLGWLVEALVGPAGRRLRADADRLADVGTVHLARHPEALARVCARLAADTRTVAVSAHHLDHLWFKDVGGGSEAARDEMARRAGDAEHAAGSASTG